MEATFPPANLSTMYSLFALELMTQENVLINIWTKCSLLFNDIMSDRVTLQISLVFQLLAVVSLVLLTPVSETVLEYKISSSEMTASQPASPPCGTPAHSWC